MGQQLSRATSNHAGKRVRGRLLRRMAAYWLLYHAVLWHAVFAWNIWELNSQPGLPAMSFLDHYTSFARSHYSLLLCAAAALPLICWDMLQFSRYIAGPLHRVEEGINCMVHGQKLETIQCRNGDSMLEFVSRFNQLIEQHNRRLSTQVHLGSPHTPSGMDEIELSLLAEIRDLREHILSDRTGLDSSTAHLISAAT